MGSDRVALDDCTCATVRIGKGCVGKSGVLSKKAIRIFGMHSWLLSAPLVATAAHFLHMADSLLQREKTLALDHPIGAQRRPQKHHIAARKVLSDTCLKLAASYYGQTH